MTANSVVNQIFQSESFVLQKGLNCPKPTIQCSWYTRKPFPVPNPRFKAVGTPDGLSLYKTHDSRRLVHQKAFSCTKPTIQGVGTPDGLSLYKTHDSRRLVHQKAFSCTKPTIQGVGTPDGLFLYQLHDSMQLVHQTAFSCTNSMIQCSWYTRKPFPVPTPIIKLSKR